MIDPKQIEEWTARAKRWRRAMGLALDVTEAPGGATVNLRGLHEQAEAIRALTADAPATIAALLSERETLLALLRRIEWSGDHGTDSAVGWPVCPACGGASPRGDARYTGDAESWARFNHRRVGHAPDCALAAAIGSAGPG